MPEGGFIYAIGAEGLPSVKIGSAKNVEARRKQLQTGQPHRLHILASIAVREDLRAIEHSIHSILADVLHGGEWFCTPMDSHRLAGLVAQARRLLEEARQPLSLFPKGAPRTFGQRVAQKRVERGWSQQELAEKADTSYQTIWRIEHGKHKEPGIYIARKIARALGISLDYLVNLYGEGEDNEAYCRRGVGWRLAHGGSMPRQPMTLTSDRERIADTALPGATAAPTRTFQGCTRAVCMLISD